MRRLLVAMVLVAAAAFPAPALANAPSRVYFTSIAGRPLVFSPANACLGTDGWIDTTLTSMTDSGRSTLSVQSSREPFQARVHGTMAGTLFTTSGVSSSTPIYQVAFDLRLNDLVTPGPAFGTPPQGIVMHTIGLDLVPVAGGPSVPVTLDVGVAVVWTADGTINVVPSFGLEHCAS
jgi:hypothetical protein